MSSDEEKNGAPRLAPRPISRPPVDAASRQAFSRPDGVQGSFVAETVRPPKYRDQGEFTPHDEPADPVLSEAFGRPFPGAESLQRHPTDAGALDGDKNQPDEPDDPWRDPGAAAALGEPAVTRSGPRGPAANAIGWGCVTCCSAGGCPTRRCSCWPSSRY